MKTIDIFYVILSLVSIVITGIVIPLLKQKYDKNKIDSTIETIDTLVKAAEQIYSQSGQGDLRRKYVLDRLKEMGISINESELKDIREASVLEINRWKKELKKESTINVINKLDKPGE